MDTEEKLMKDAFDNIPEVSKIYIEKLSDIFDRVQDILKRKNWTMEDLADKMNMNIKELENWFYTIHNFKIREIVKMESMLGEEIIQISKIDKKEMTEEEWSKLDRKNAEERQRLVSKRIQMDIKSGKYKIEDLYFSVGLNGTSGTSGEAIK